MGRGDVGATPNRGGGIYLVFDNLHQVSIREKGEGEPKKVRGKLGFSGHRKGKRVKRALQGNHEGDSENTAL